MTCVFQLALHPAAFLHPSTSLGRFGRGNLLRFLSFASHESTCLPTRAHAHGESLGTAQAHTACKLSSVGLLRSKAPVTTLK